MKPGSSNNYTHPRDDPHRLGSPKLYIRPMPSVNLKKHHRAVQEKGRSMKRFLTRIEQGPPRGLKTLAASLNEAVWQETDCTTCANCCRTMTPTLKPADRKRIAAHLGIDTSAFEQQYLLYDKKDKDWRMQRQPCVFLDLKTNKCTIYAVRPKDCAGFPHLTKSPMPDYMHIHKQNIHYCPATFRFVEKLMNAIEFVKA